MTFSGDAAKDADVVLTAIRAGHVYSTVDGVGGPGELLFTATNAAGTASTGDALPSNGATTFRVEVNAPSEARIDLIRNGVVDMSAMGASLDRVVDPGSDAAAYRVEVSLPGAPGEPPVPWIVSNPIYLGRAGDARPSTTATKAAPTTVATIYADGPARGWTVETSEASLGALDVVPAARGTQLGMRYALGGTASSGAYAAFAMTAGELSKYDRLIFTARADHPSRISVQLRQPGGKDGQRWYRSVYVDPMPREITVYFSDMKPRGVPAGAVLALDKVQSVLFVMDTVNTALGGRGQILMDDVRYAK
jgi:hypothetical protein